jgi:hypothetical protein
MNRWKERKETERELKKKIWGKDENFEHFFFHKMKLKSFCKLCEVQEKVSRKTGLFVIRKETYFSRYILLDLAQFAKRLLIY